MSKLRQGDEKMHYSDHSHRWIAPSEREQSAWNDDVRAHLEDHLLTLRGRPESAGSAPAGPRARIPRQRDPRRR